MSVQFYEMGSRLFGDTVGKVSDNLTSVVLAASLITLALGYITKMLLKESPDTDLVSMKKEKSVP